MALPDACLGVVLLDGRGDDPALVAGEGAGDDVGDGATGPLLPQLPDGILGVGAASQQPKLVHRHVGNVAFEQSTLGILLQKLVISRKRS